MIQTLPLQNIQLLAKQAVEGFIIGLHKSPFHGFSVEFAEHKQYNPGDNVKNIDWRIYGKSGKLFVKKFDEETNLRCNLVIDISGSMQFPDKPKQYNKLQFSAIAAAAIVQLLKQQQDAGGITLFDDAITFKSNIKSSGSHINNLYLELEKLLAYKSKNKSTATTKVLHEVADNTHKRSLIIVFSDMMDRYSESEELFDALQHLKYNKHEVIIFNVHDGAHELDFNWENRPYEFIDLETGNSLKLNTTAAKEIYLQKMQAYQKAIALKCMQFGIDMVQADINKTMEQILMPYFLKRNKMV